MQAALSDISRGRANTIICANISRYSRDVEHQQRIKKDVRSAGGRVIFCDMDFDDTPEGDLAFNIMGGFAQYEKQLIKTRSMKGKLVRAEDGQQPQRSTPAYGYHIVTNAEVECGVYPAEMRGRYVVVEERAQVVRELFTRYAAGGIGYSPLARELNARGIPASRGGHWNPICVNVILRNPVYKGEPAYGRTSRTTGELGADDRHPVTGKPLIRARAIRRPSQPIFLTSPPIVSNELWERVQERLSTNQSLQGGNPRRARMLSGRVQCPCGHDAVLVGRPTNKYYQCGKTVSGRALFGEHSCKRETFCVALIERSVIDALLDVVKRPEALVAAQRAYAESSNPTRSIDDRDAARKERDAIDNAVLQLARDEAAAVQGQIAGIRAGASPDAYQTIFADIAARRKDLEDRRGSIARILAKGAEQGSKSMATPKIETKVVNDVALVLSSDSIEGSKKRDVVGTVIDHVVCRPDGADIYFLPGLGTTEHQRGYDLSDTCKSTLTELMQ